MAGLRNARSRSSGGPSPSLVTYADLDQTHEVSLAAFGRILSAENLSARDWRAWRTQPRSRGSRVTRRHVLPLLEQFAHIGDVSDGKVRVVVVPLAEIGGGERPLEL